MEKQLLIGATKEHNLVFANITNDKYFTVCFDEVRPINWDKIDWEEVAEYFINGLGDDELYRLCEEYDCRPSDLAINLADDEYEREYLIDTYDEIEHIWINDEQWRLDFQACGQHDTRDCIEEFVDRKIYYRLHELWDMYHLNTINKEIEQELNEMIEKLEEVNTIQWITEYIIEHIDEFDDYQ